MQTERDNKKEAESANATRKRELVLARDRVIFTKVVRFTDSVKEQVTSDDLCECLGRHLCGDWGVTPEMGRKSNDRVLVTKTGRIFSAYQDGKGVCFWIVTDFDAGVTFAMLPEEY